MLQQIELTDEMSPCQDVAGKIAAFVSQSPRAVCVLSAMGSISRAVLRNLGDHASSAAMAPPSYNNNPSIYEVGHHPTQCREQQIKEMQLKLMYNPQ
jgi:hypothetical protein